MAPLLIPLLLIAAGDPCDLSYWSSRAGQDYARAKHKRGRAVFWEVLTMPADAPWPWGRCEIFANSSGVTSLAAPLFESDFQMEARFVPDYIDRLRRYDAEAADSFELRFLNARDGASVLPELLIALAPYYAGEIGVPNEPGIELYALFSRERPEVYKCVAEHKLANPPYERLSLDFTLEPSGRAGHIVITPERFRSLPVAECLVDAVKSWRFTGPKRRSQHVGFLVDLDAQP